MYNERWKTSFGPAQTGLADETLILVEHLQKKYPNWNKFDQPDQSNTCEGIEQFEINIRSLGMMMLNNREKGF